MHGKQMQGKHTVEKRIAKLFEMDWPNQCMDEESFCTDAQTKRIFAQMQSNGCTDEENFCTDAVKRIHG